MPQKVEAVATLPLSTKKKNLKMTAKAARRDPEWKEWRQAMNHDMFVLCDTYLPSTTDAAAKAYDIASVEVNKDGRRKINFNQFVSRLTFDMFEAVLFGESPKTNDSHNAMCSPS